MSSSQLAQNIKQTLEHRVPLDALPTLLTAVNTFVAEVSSFSKDRNAPTLDDVLRRVYDEDYDESVTSHVVVFLATLNALDNLLPTSSLVSIWFELILLPALRNPNLPQSAVQHAQYLVLKVINHPSPVPQDKVVEFQSRIMQLYLEEFYNSNSNNDTVESGAATIDQQTRLMRACWRKNLESLAISFSASNPHVILSILFCNQYLPGSCRISGTIWDHCFLILPSD